jgi:(p)ppGpp synthase/HD superfamily hydrolase
MTEAQGGEDDVSPSGVSPQRSVTVRRLAAMPPALTERFLAAVALAQEVHGHVRRSGTEIPYLAHLLVVTGLVIEDGGDEDQAIAAMLHDAVEDGGGRAMLERIARSFGMRVVAIVEGCSDTVEVDVSEAWIERKRRYLAHLREIEDDAILRVALADKVHNARSIVRDYRDEGHALWERFTQKTARETVALLDESAVQKVSFDAPEQASAVANRLLAEEASGRDCRPRDGITFHGEHDPRAIDELIATIGPPGYQVVAR